MFPRWSRGVSMRGAILASVCLALVVGVLLVRRGLGQDSEAAPAGVTGEKKAVPSVAKPEPLRVEKEAKTGKEAPSDAAPLKTSDDKAKPEPGKPITLNAAITLVEDAGKGEVVKGEKSGKGAEAQFNLEVLNPKGERVRLVVSATGKVIVEVVEPSTSPRKGKGKGK